MKPFLLFTVLLLLMKVQAQQKISGVVADSATGAVLPFATVQASAGRAAVITEIDGRFTLVLPAGENGFRVSYIGHRPRLVAVTGWKAGDTVFLAADARAMNEVVVRSADDRIRRIVNTAIRNKPRHNPDLYDRYSCTIYYKMKADMLLDTATLKMRIDTSRRQRRPVREGQRRDTMRLEPSGEAGMLSPDKHIVLVETVTRRSYRRPHQVQEEVMASRFSGLKKTFFPNVVTDVIPFHVYGDYISFNGKDYNNPIAKGWQGRYRFTLADEVVVGADTVFILSFEPRPGAVFNTLRGTVYINSHGYAISHLIASTADPSADREVRFEQISERVGDKWFPRELNYAFFVRRMMAFMGMEWRGHSVIDSVAFENDPRLSFDKARPVKLGDSVDLHSELAWESLRKDSITRKEKRTYIYIDSMAERYRFDRLVGLAAGLTLGRLRLGKLDLDLNRLAASNRYEGTRIGLGLYTNDSVSRHFSVGGWAGYGFRDRVWKGGASARIYPAGNRDHWLDFAYQKTYRTPGEVFLHPELYRPGLRNWILSLVDRVEEYQLSASTRRGYWELGGGLLKQDLQTRYPSGFIAGGKEVGQFDRREAGISIRYAYAEKRIPVFGTYFSEGTRYPVVYGRLAKGLVRSGSYAADYLSALGAVSWSTHINRWGKEQFMLQGGIIRTEGGQPLPRSFLLGGNGFKNDQAVSFYAWGGFQTLRPFDYFADKYLALFYKHDFDKYLWEAPFSKPVLSLAHNGMQGSLRRQTKDAHPGVPMITGSYHESGILLSQILRRNFRIAHLGLRFGAFYHWGGPFNWKRNGAFVLGLSGDL